MIFKSRQVNLDPKPYMGWSGQRYAADERHTEGYGDGSFKYDPRPEFETTRDPYPYVTTLRNGFTLRTVNKISQSTDDGKDTGVESSNWAPRREQFDTPVNPILVALRKWLGGEKYSRGDYAGFWFYADWEATAAQINHARRVLTRLENFK